MTPDYGRILHRPVGGRYGAEAPDHPLGGAGIQVGGTLLAFLASVADATGPGAAVARTTATSTGCASAVGASVPHLADGTSSSAGRFPVCASAHHSLLSAERAPRLNFCNPHYTILFPYAILTRMKGTHKTLFVVGIVLILMPFIAIPYTWKGWLAALFGATVLAVFVMLRRADMHTNEHRPTITNVPPTLS